MIEKNHVYLEKLITLHKVYTGCAQTNTSVLTRRGADNIKK